MSNTHATDQRSEWERLLEVATPEMYRCNLFRVLGVPVTATPKDVQRQQTRRQMQQRLGLAEAPRHTGPLALDPPASDEQVRAAMERLNDPSKRIIDEIFWFWPMEERAAADEALQAIEQGDAKRAAEIWRGRAEADRHGHIAAHNLAVLDHLLALDYEAQLSRTGLSEKALHKLDDLWARGLSRWKQVVECDRFWISVKDRIRCLDDPQLTTGVARRIRSTLPAALLKINGMIALRAAEGGEGERARAHADRVRSSAFAGDAGAQALQLTVRPVRDRVRVLTESAQSEADAEPRAANNVARRLLDETRPLIQVVDAVLPDSDAVRRDVHDAVATTLLRIQVAYANETDDWADSVELLELALSIAVGATVRERLETNMEIVRTNLEQGRCGFCRDAQSDERHGIPLTMWGDLKKHPVGIDRYRVTWNQLKLTLPRCAGCAAKHRRAWIWTIGTGLAALLVIAGTVAQLHYAAPDPDMELWVKLAIGVAASAVIGGIMYAVATMAMGVGSPHFLDNIGPVKERLRQGWHIGLEPSEEQQQAAPLALDALPAGSPGVSSGASGGGCPGCGFTFGWSGSACSHCGYGR